MQSKEEEEKKKKDNQQTKTLNSKAYTQGENVGVQIIGHK